MTGAAPLLPLSVPSWHGHARRYLYDLSLINVAAEIVEYSKSKVFPLQARLWPRRWVEV